MNMSVEKGEVLFVCRYRGLSLDLQSFPGGELLHGETEGLITECIHSVCGANNSNVSTTTTSNCMRSKPRLSVLTCSTTAWTLTHFHISLGNMFGLHFWSSHFRALKKSLTKMKCSTSVQTVIVTSRQLLKDTTCISFSLQVCSQIIPLLLKTHLFINLV